MVVLRVSSNMVMPPFVVNHRFVAIWRVVGASVATLTADRFAHAPHTSRYVSPPAGAGGHEPHTVTRLVPSHETITPETLRHPEVSVHEDGGMSSVRTPDSASRAGPGGADGSGIREGCSPRRSVSSGFVSQPLMRLILKLRSSGVSTSTKAALTPPSRRRRQFAAQSRRRSARAQGQESCQ